MAPSIRPFRFGLSSRTSWTPAGWRDLARRVESSGFATLLLADHLADGLPPPFTPLVSAAEATSRLRVGTLVLNNDFHHPVWLAREAATLDLISAGRFELGMGAGHMKSEYDAAGLRFDRAGVRVDRLTESVGILRRLLAGETVVHDGEHFTVRDHRCFPLPDGPIPMLIGGNGTRVLQLAATTADIVGFTGFSQREGTTEVRLDRFTAAGLADRVEVVRTAAGDRFAELELNLLVQLVAVTDDRRSVAARFLDRVGGALTVDDLLDSPFLLIGTHDQIAEQLVERRERFGISYIAVFEPALDAIAPVVERLAGSPSGP
jgi:probable F420-dependent oxidoreductase